MKEKSKVDVDSTSTLNRKDLVVKVDLQSLESKMKAYMKTYGKSKRDPFQVEYVFEIAQQDSGSLDCGIVVVYAEYLSEGLCISYSGIDAQYYRLRYSSLLCKYGSKKEKNGYFSENDDPPRPRSKFVEKQKTDSVFHIK
ncbi:hypothetical protein CQW23_18922 [Capsicum baccatum]|uniref:Ubiquitin-like protease family profile domain-containing protein n=1 Tax=Capsicum baccatum TaxID=33114 RepID=A0A2G2W4C3_CAPBA|nr:hypothetical protein CQW23_18922 [Capsicum baccatum]